MFVATSGRGLGIVAAICLLASHATGTLDNGADDCRCIDHHTGDDPEFFSIVERSGKVRGDMLQSSPTQMLPRNYGSVECRKWDKGGATMPECGVFGPPRFCVLRWCYVDPQNCHPRRRARASTLASGLYYSYTTCGNIDDYFVGQTYWAGMAPILAFAFGNQIGMDIQHDDNTLKAMVLFAYQVLQKMQVPEEAIQYQNLSRSSTELYQSKFTACARDLALGHLDICVGDFWATEERRLMKAGFSNTIYTESQYLYVPTSAEERSLLKSLKTPLEPFTAGLWLLLCSVVVAAGFMMALLEYGETDGEFAHMGKGATFVHCTYLAIQSFLNAGTFFVPGTAPGRVFAVGLAFFACVAIANFTANTASFLLYENRAASVESLEEALAAGMKVCVMEALLGQLLPNFPALATQGVVAGGADQLFPRVADKVCDAAILPEPYVMGYHSRGMYCTYQAVGRPVLAFPVGMFVSDRLQDSFNWAVVARRQDGTWKSLESRVYPTSMCVLDEIGDRQLEAQHMTGNCGLLLICFVISLILLVVRKVEQSKTVQSVEANVAHEAVDIEHKVARQVKDHAPKLAVPQHPSNHPQADPAVAAKSSTPPTREPAKPAEPPRAGRRSPRIGLTSEGPRWQVVSL